MALRDAFADLLTAPANPANLAKTRADAGLPPDAGVCESLRILRIGGTQAATDSEKFARFANIRRPENELPTRTNACDSQNSQHSQGGNPLMTREQADRAHWPAWDGPEIDRTIARIHLFTRRGIGPDHAEHLAERALLCDRELDDRRMCLECTHYRPGHCGSHGRAGLHSPIVGHDLAGLLQRCPAFEVQA